MTLESWIEEYYPVPADEVKKEDALDHSIRKWEGLNEENLSKHGLTKSYRCIHEPEYKCLSIFDEGHRATYFNIDGNTCALCHHYHQKDKKSVGCKNCPLTPVAIHPKINEESCGYEYAQFTFGDPEPMISLLLKARDNEANDK